MGDKLEKPQLLMADKFRHRTSTQFVILEIPHESREMFYKHMGHSDSEQMKRNVYQCLLVIRETTEVGNFLQNLDQKTSHQTVHVPSISTPNIKEVCSLNNTSEIWPVLGESDTENTSYLLCKPLILVRFFFSITLLVFNDKVVIMS